MRYDVCITLNVELLIKQLHVISYKVITDHTTITTKHFRAFFVDAKRKTKQQQQQQTP